MNPHVEDTSKKDLSTFTLSGVNVSLANALRRTIISDIPIVVFKTAPYEENKANITVNTCRLNNEILKQRLSCIPIHINDLEIPIKNYLVEVKVENNTDSIIYVTTEHFKIKNTLTNEYLSEKDTKKIFPPNDYTGYYIDFVRLRPKISDEIPGEKFEMTCELSISSAKEDGMFNVVSTCSYGCTPDEIEMDSVLKKKLQQWKDEGLKKEDIDFEATNWKLLDGLRIIKKDSFDFILESIGIYSNFELIDKACDILIEKINNIDKLSDTDELEIKISDNTMSNCFDIILENEDYTIGKIIEYAFYCQFFEGIKTLTYCGFKKLHPHDTYSTVRVAYRDPIDKSGVKQNIKVCVNELVKVYQKIKKEINKYKN